MNGDTIVQVLSSGVSAEMLADFESRIKALEEAEAKKTERNDE